MFDAMVWGCIILAFLVSFTIGANDAANALGTAHGAGALPLLKLVLCGSVFIFVGAFWCSGKVAGALAENIIAELSTLDVELQE
jgi:inorganic phosphate transporter, PiT family